MTSTEFLLIIQAGTNAMDKHPDLAKRITKIEVKWKAHDYGECGQNYLPDINVEFGPPTLMCDDCSGEEW